MKIHTNKIKVTPPNLDFNLCVFGEPNPEVVEWSNHWGITFSESGRFTNLILPDDFKINDAFIGAQQFNNLDGFSPNLNKYLHVGHLSNLVLASAFQNLGISNKTISILGDTLEGVEEHSDALSKYKTLCEHFNYSLGNIFYASKVKYYGDLLLDGEGEYSGTKVFNVGDEKIVGVKSDGSTSYFYQDIALANQLDGTTLYLTGFEQNNHFELLKKVDSNINHLGLGLVTIDGEKMSSRKGNVVMAQELIDKLMDTFGCIKLVSNVIAGQILNSKPESIKQINTTTIFEPKASAGLYLSYTMARLKSAGMKINYIDDFNSMALRFSMIKAKNKLMPNILFKELVTLCKDINILYGKYKISDNKENEQLFQPLLDDLMFGMSKLGLHEIEKV